MRKKMKTSDWDKKIKYVSIIKINTHYRNLVKILAEQQPVGRWAATRGSTGWIKEGTCVAI